MAILTITNLTSEPVHVQDAYMTIPANKSVTVSRPLPRLEDMPGMFALRDAGEISWTAAIGNSEWEFRSDPNATRIFHKPTITPSEAEVAPGQGPSPVVFGTVMGLHYDNATDKAYRVLKIDSNFTGTASFHVHWTKSGDLNESTNTVRWQLSYTVFNGSSDEVALVAPTVLTWDDTYDDAGTTSRIVYRTGNETAAGFVAGYYVGICLEYVAGGTTISGGPVVISADLLWEGSINQ